MKKCKTSKWSSSWWTTSGVTNFDMINISSNVHKIVHNHTVDGRNPEPVEVGSLSQYLQVFVNIPGGCLGFLPSTVMICSKMAKSTMGLPVCPSLVSVWAKRIDTAWASWDVSRRWSGWILFTLGRGHKMTTWAIWSNCLVGGLFILFWLTKYIINQLFSNHLVNQFKITFEYFY